MYEKLKYYLQDDALFITCLLLLIGIISFGLGRFSVLNKDSTVSWPETEPGVVFCNNNKDLGLIEESELNPLNFDHLNLVASKNGTKFHLLDCPGASQIKEENKIYFDSVELASAAGYTAAANCSGLQ